jgi:molybdenum cofactor biosynthesis enzyme MoaA
MLSSENKTLDNLREMLIFSRETNCQLHLIELYPEETSDYMSFSQIEKRLFNLGYGRKPSSGLKVRYQKEGFPDVFITFIPCAFAISPLLKDAKLFCKENQSIYINNNLDIQPCFEKENNKISILDAVKDKNTGVLVEKIKLARTEIGQGCPLIR